MRGIADQRQPFGDERARDEIAERKRARSVERLDLAEMQTETPFEFVGGIIKQVTVDVSGEAYRDLEKEFVGAFARD